MKDNLGLPVEVSQTNRSPTRGDVLYSFGRSLAYGRWTGCPRRSLDPQAGVYSALGPKAGVSSGPRARVVYKSRSHGFCECQMFVWSRTCDPTLTRARKLARTHAHARWPTSPGAHCSQPTSSSFIRQATDFVDHLFYLTSN